jgi:CBS domain containing-hemolysin-like protein
VSLDDAREMLGLDLPAEDVDSLAGFIYSHLGTIPKKGEVIQVGEAVLTVVNVRGQRIGKVRVRSEKPFPGAVPEQSDPAEGLGQPFGHQYEPGSHSPR